MNQKLTLLVVALLLVVPATSLRGAGVFLSPGESFTYEFKSMTGLVTWTVTNEVDCEFSGATCLFTFFYSRPGATGEVQIELFETDTNDPPFLVEQIPLTVSGRIYTDAVGTKDPEHLTWADEKGALRITLLRGDPTQIVDLLLNAQESISTSEGYCQHAVHTLVPIREGPHLDVVQLDRTQAKISWLTNTWGGGPPIPNYVLETAGSVNAASWTRLTNTVSRVSDFFSVTVNIGEENAFFRLSKP